MKQMKTLLTTAALGAILFTSCSKDESTMATPQAAATNATARISPTDGANTINAATIDVLSINFSGVKNGTQISTSNKDPRTINLMGPMITSDMMHIPLGTYDKMRLTLTPTVQRSSPTLKIRGNWENLSYTIDVNGDMTMGLDWGKTNLLNGGDWERTFTLDMKKALANVTSEDFSTATVVNGDVLISSTSNTPIYNIVVQNLQNYFGITVR